MSKFQFFVLIRRNHAHYPAAFWHINISVVWCTYLQQLDIRWAWFAMHILQIPRDLPRYSHIPSKILADLIRSVQISSDLCRSHQIFTFNVKTFLVFFFVDHLNLSQAAISGHTIITPTRGERMTGSRFVYGLYYWSCDCFI